MEAEIVVDVANDGDAFICRGLDCVCTNHAASSLRVYSFLNINTIHIHHTLLITH